MMKRLFAGALAAALVLGACGDKQDEATAVCTDRNGVRVDDSQCGDSSGSGMNGFLWFYMLSSLNRPAFGTQVVNNNYYTQNNPYRYSAPPKSVKVERNVPKTGAPAKAPKINPNPAPKPQDKPNPNIKPGGPVNRPPAPAPRAPAPPPRAK